MSATVSNTNNEPLRTLSPPQDQHLVDISEKDPALTNEQRLQKIDDKNLKLKILNVVAFVITMVLNGLGSSGTISGKAVGEISDTFPTSITPDGYAFSIWGVIYTFLAVFVVYQALPQKWVKTRNQSLIYDQISYIFALNMGLNGLWICVFSFGNKVSMIFSVLIIFSLLVTILILHKKIHSNLLENKLNTIEIICMRIGVSLYGGWVTGASIVNVSAMLVSFDVTDANSIAWSESGWCCLMLSIALVIYTAFVIRKLDPVYGAVLIWVSVAIIKARPNADDVVTTATVVSSIIGVVIAGTCSYIVYKLIIHNKQVQNKNNGQKDNQINKEQNNNNDQKVELQNQN